MDQAPLKPAKPSRSAVPPSPPPPLPLPLPLHLPQHAPLLPQPLPSPPYGPCPVQPAGGHGTVQERGHMQMATAPDAVPTVPPSPAPTLPVPALTTSAAALVGQQCSKFDGAHSSALPGLCSIQWACPLTTIATLPSPAPSSITPAFTPGPTMLPFTSLGPRNLASAPT
ncbi:hypothetical protein DACRYDRAFT_108998 [Dacryopinax primogenitus]|uniref:Uncharacterized protein n=1 Tax=Dacryopinax primogenitus (strain DJM 731) TaxID=1858805 RepID=M5G329_DACPD|nr:uncharacterized protein DACRYDRAFT_108998 [Dacryopinax primogenitus]EJU00252.1 hypothetical protein DACRYDRAFT_108998 [Dacryopinax primogenitus]